MKHSIILFCLILLCYACNSKRLKGITNQRFQNFEINYSNGWARAFTVYTDSDKIFIVPFSKLNRLSAKPKFQLSDSIRPMFDSLFVQMKKDTALHDIYNGTMDVRWVLVKAYSEKDTLEIYQGYKIAALFQPIIDTMSSLLQPFWKENEEIIKAKFSKEQ
jgi:hypothetical protein